jgi:hypothetical protein
MFLATSSPYQYVILLIEKYTIHIKALNYFGKDEHNASTTYPIIIK